MVKICPLCKGQKTIPASNGCEDDTEHQPCTVCGGHGEVDEERKPDSPVIVYKYWGAMAG